MLVFLLYAVLDYVLPVLLQGQARKGRAGRKLPRRSRRQGRREGWPVTVLPRGGDYPGEGGLRTGERVRGKMIPLGC